MRKKAASFHSEGGGFFTECFLGSRSRVDFNVRYAYSIFVGTLHKEVMPMPHFLRLVLANTLGRIFADLFKRLFD